MKAVVFLSEKVAQKCLEKGCSATHANPIAISVFDALEWLMITKQLHVKVTFWQNNGNPYYTFSILRIVKGLQVGCTLNFEIRYKDHYEAYESGIEYCIDCLWDVGENEKKS